MIMRKRGGEKQKQCLGYLNPLFFFNYKKVKNMKPRKYTDSELSEWYSMRKQGMSFNDLSTLTGVPKAALAAAINRYAARLEIERKIQEAGITLIKGDSDEEPQTQTIVKKELSDYTPREIIKYLYSIGYRIDHEGLYRVEKRRINLKSVVEE